MTDPFDKEFAELMQDSDREVRFEWAAMSSAVRGKAKQKKQSRRVMQFAIGVAGVSAVIAVLCFQFIDQSNLNSPNIAVVQKTALDSINNTIDDPSANSEADGPTVEQLAEQLRRAQEELDRLNEIRAAQQFAILKEYVSRTEVNQQAIAAYHF